MLLVIVHDITYDLQQAIIFSSHTRLDLTREGLSVQSHNNAAISLCAVTPILVFILPCLFILPCRLRNLHRNRVCDRVRGHHRGLSAHSAIYLRRKCSTHVKNSLIQNAREKTLSLPSVTISKIPRLVIVLERCHMGKTATALKG